MAMSGTVGSNNNERLDVINVPHKNQLDQFAELPLRRQDEHIGYGNIMADPRVWRGHAFDIYKKSAKKEKEQQLTKPAARSEKHKAASKLRPKGKVGGSGDACSSQTYRSILEPISDRDFDVDNSQRIELKRIRPTSPPFIPRTTFKIAWTLVGHHDLFVFDHEVRSLLETLIGEALEQGLVESLQEEEQLQITRDLNRFVECSTSLKAETQRQKERNRRHHEEKGHRRVERDETANADSERCTQDNINRFAKEVVGEVVPAILLKLEDGFIFSSMEQELNTLFEPWLSELVYFTDHEMRAASLWTNVLVREVLWENSYAVNLAKMESTRMQRGPYQAEKKVVSN